MKIADVSASNARCVVRNMIGAGITYKCDHCIRKVVKHACTRARTRTYHHTHARARTRAPARTRTHAHARAQQRTYACTHTHSLTHSLSLTHTHTHARSHTRTHTHMQPQQSANTITCSRIGGYSPLNSKKFNTCVRCGIVNSKNYSLVKFAPC